MPEKINLENINIILQRPRYPENIGAAARAIRNMGIEKLSVVQPHNYDLEKVVKMSTHAARDVVEKIRIYDELDAALSQCQYIVGTTARLGSRRQVIHSPSRLAKHLVSISQDNQIGILFGPEDRGLTNEDIWNCHVLVNIPTDEFASLNLAQAVMVVCYELFKASIEKSSGFTPRLATHHELEGMYEQLKEILVKINFLNPENPEYWLNNVRHFFSRLPLRAKEVNIVRGICRQINWYGKKCYEDGFKAGRSDSGKKPD
ncbi:MAG: RNA methyltransferase [Desulfobacterales bacterium]|jgi:tRNA/rRNA methyltransferase|nr:RNA methyltransferase [Desulfobacterales bacterium]